MAVSSTFLVFLLALAFPWSPGRNTALGHYVAGAMATRTVVPIERLQVGRWVLAGNPSGEEDLEFGTEVDPASWKKLVLDSAKKDGSRADVELLRPDWWLELHKAAVGGTVHVAVPECGIDGDATVLRIEACPHLAPRPGPDWRVVTGTFHHHNAQVIDVRIEGRGGQVYSRSRATKSPAVVGGLCAIAGRLVWSSGAERVCCASAG